MARFAAGPPSSVGGGQSDDPRPTVLAVWLLQPGAAGAPRRAAESQYARLPYAAALNRRPVGALCMKKAALPLLKTQVSDYSLTPSYDEYC